MIDPLSVQGVCRSCRGSRRRRGGCKFQLPKTSWLRNLLPVSPSLTCTGGNSQAGGAWWAHLGGHSFWCGQLLSPYLPLDQVIPWGSPFCCSSAFCFLHSVSLPMSRLFPKPGVTIWRFKLSGYIKKVRHGASPFPTEFYCLALEGLHVCNFLLQFMIRELLPVFLCFFGWCHIFVLSLWVQLTDFDGWARCSVWPQIKQVVPWRGPFIFVLLFCKHGGALLFFDPNSPLSYCFLPSRASKFGSYTSPYGAKEHQPYLWSASTLQAL